jgi:hypothetical protein
MAGKKFFVGTGKKARSSKGKDTALSPPKSEFESRPRRFLVGDGTKVAVAVPVTRDHVTDGEESLSDVPRALAEIEKLYACEPASIETIKQLAAISGGTVADLEHRRHDFQRKEKEALCPMHHLPPDRRRCMTCPYWDINKEVTPF